MDAVDIDSYIQCYFGHLSAEDVLKRQSEFKKRANEDPDFLKKYFVTKLNGEITQGSCLFAVEQGNYAFLEPKNPTNANLDEIFNRVKMRFKDLGGNKLICRVTHAEGKENLYESLVRAGFKKDSERVEFKTPLKSLDFSDSEKSPLVFKAPLVEERYSLEELGKIMEQVSEGSPDFSSDDSGLDCIKSYLSDEEMYREKDCIQLGYLKDFDEVAAFIVAQVAPDDGWSSIPFMSVHPRYRGQRLGKWLQQHGIQMMNSQGGKFYHGGTDRKNIPMIKTFESNGCTHFRDLSEWSFRNTTY